MLLANKNAVITGANRGIGKAIAEVYASQGANIWACTRNPENDGFKAFIQLLCEKYQIWIEPISLDLTGEASVADAAKAITRKKMPIDIIVNNAGIIDTALFAMTPIRSMRSLFEVNFFSQMAFTQKLVRVMIKQKSGSIINLSSSAAIEGNEGRLSYAASKSALLTASKVMSRELGPHNIRVNTLAPGLTETDMMRDSHPEDVIARALERISLQRVAGPQEIANAALFLGSDLASYITGHVLSVDGGM